MTKNGNHARSAYEFGVKQALGYEFTEDQLKYAPAIGAGIGGLSGAVFSKRKNMLRNALIGAISGGASGYLGAEGYRLGAKPWNWDERGLRTMMQANSLLPSDDPRQLVGENLFHGRGLALGGLGVIGGSFAGDIMRALAPKEDEDDDAPRKKQSKYANENKEKKTEEDTAEDNENQRSKKKPSAGAAMYMAGLRGNDAWSRAQKDVSERAKKEAPGGMHDRLAPLNEKFLNLRGRTIAHQAVTPSTRILSDALGGEGALGGMLVNALGSIGGGPDVQDKVRNMYDASGIEAYRDRVRDDVAPTSRETMPHKQWQGVFADKDYLIAAHRWNRANHPAQYWLNPFDRTGPLQELADRALRRSAAGAGEPETTGGRVFRAAVPGAALFMGGQAAQDKMRASANRSGLYHSSSPAAEFGRKAAHAYADLARTRRR